MRTFASQGRNGLRPLARACAGMKSEAGSSLVELAIAGPLLFLLLLGGVGMASVIYDSVAVENAAMAGIQYGAYTPITAADTTGIQNAAAASAPSLSLTTTSSTSCICSDGDASACQPTDCPNGASIETILTVKTQVTITPSVRFPGIGSIPGLPSSYTLYGQAVQKVLE